MYYDCPVILEDFLNYIETIKGKSPNTVKEYYFDLRTFFRFLKIRYRLVDRNTDFEEIDIQDVDISLIRKVTLQDLYAFISYVDKQRDNKNYAKARKVASIRSFFKYLHTKVKLIDENPAQDLESPKTDRRHPVYLTLDEAKRLLDVIDGPFKERDYAIITLFLNCGLRLSELVSIDIDKIKGDILTVVGKGNKERTIYLNEACVEAINKYLEVRPKENLKDKKALFISKRKNRISHKAVQHLVKKYLKLAGLDTKKYSTHKLRHTAATLMYKYGNVDIRALQQILGHENVSTTQIYTHIDDERLRQAVKSNPLSQTKKE
ncbi:tyrosine recombinase XerC [Caldisalinibacter kiritimatiensis]|uniref:Site-specific tyrosine recombinase n=1 Tax=Caldisalinibacter kiritimatiensis TaxID=1304284 RepID=R1CYS7_9FIRM|nr:tyrosine recombinase XerC [Caldisalinibacter kiritimatiensis]EOD01739.1 Site-specific tyrosine recombinase [Caldisalinibacter kiritimatiensis]